MTPRFFSTAALLVALSLLAGCDDHEEHLSHDPHAEHENDRADEHDEPADHGHDEPADHDEHADEHDDHGHDEHAESVRFVEGRGLSLDDATRAALDVATAAAAERPLADDIRLIAQVFAASPRVLASATVPVSDAGHYREHAFRDAELVRIDRSAAPATRFVDLVVALDRQPAPVPGEFVELAFATEPTSVLAVPRSALLDAATGTFVYLVDGDFFRRTPVETGARSDDFVEIADGLRAGDVVVTSPVELLWLTELRLTKGGGHSH